MHTIKDTEPPNELTDEALLNAIAGGAVWAMESLYERYSRILYSLAYRMVADHQVAEDLKKRPENAIFIALSGLRTTEETSNPILLLLRTMTRVLSHLMSLRTSPTWLSPCKL